MYNNPYEGYDQYLFVGDSIDVLSPVKFGVPNTTMDYDNVTYSKENIAILSQTGKITAQKHGNVTINYSTLLKLGGGGNSIYFFSGSVAHVSDIKSDVYTIDKTNGEIDIRNDVSVSAVANDDSATITGTGNISLKYGSNEINIEVSAENDAKKMYTLIIVRPDNRSSNNYLKSLSIAGSSIKFKKDLFNIVLVLIRALIHLI